MLCSVRTCPLAVGDCETSVQCNTKVKLEEALHKYFKFPTFRHGQLDALLPVLHGRDVFVRMATGARKSLCMFLAPLAVSESAVGVVISPLNGLMEQQVKSLSDVGVSAVRASNSDQLSEVAAGKYRFVFMAPETAVSPPWRNIFSIPTIKKNLVLVAIDEAHCICEWGKDFRTSFAKIGGLRALTDVPFMALTASAPPDTQCAIIKSLQLKQPATITRQLDRPNIYLSARTMKGLKRDLQGLMSSLASVDPSQIPKTIIFTQTKDMACRIYNILRKSAFKIHYVSMYHASLTPKTKSFVQHQFETEESCLRCLVATIAFGMGMDIPDVDLVVVYGAPDTIAQLYQLCGRAGRSGLPARAHVFYSPRQKFKDTELQGYCSGNENCRRVTLLRSVGSMEVVNRNDACCDVCTPSVPYCALDLLTSTTGQKRKRRPVLRGIGKAAIEKLRLRLIAEREKLMSEHLSYKMIGPNFVCSDAAIGELCQQAKYVNCVDDVNTYHIRPEFRERIFNVLMETVETVATVPPPKRSRCHV